MGKPFEIKIRVEDVALGGVLRKLHEMPGVSNVDLNLGHGGTGAGGEKLAAAAAERRPGASQEKVVRALMAAGRPMKRIDIMKAAGINEAQANTAFAVLKKANVLQSHGHGMYGLVAQGEVIPPALALPAPVTAAKSPNGRLLKGAGEIVMMAILVRKPSINRVELGHQMRASGVPLKSVAAMLSRAIRDKLVKRHGAGHNAVVELTSKGQHHAQAAAQHG